jgi:DNA polymerase III delta prime subunit
MIYFHPQTKRTIDASREAHALILVGDEGVGLTSAAKSLAHPKELLITVLPEKDEKVDIEKGTITIQSIRRLYDLTKTHEPEGRLVVIDYAERMGVPAQNAFLKLLEEPIKGTRFALLTHNEQALLPTIRSRSQTIIVRPIQPEQSEKLLNDLKVFDATKRAQLLFIAAGRPAELTRLAGDETLFTQRAQIVKDARLYITGTSYDKLKLASAYKNDRQAALTLMSDASKMLRKSLSEGNTDTATVRFIERIELMHKRISEQGNVRLQLSVLQ